MVGLALPHDRERVVLLIGVELDEVEDSESLLQLRTLPLVYLPGRPGDIYGAGLDGQEGVASLFQEAL